MYGNPGAPSSYGGGSHSAATAQQRRGSIPAHMYAQDAYSAPTPATGSAGPSSYGGSPYAGAFAAPGSSGGATSSMSSRGPPSLGSRGPGGAGGASGGISHARRGSLADLATSMMGEKRSEEAIANARRLSVTVEDTVETVSRPVKPYMRGTGRFLIVVTFIEDALRITTQFSDQNYYMQRHRGFPWGLSHLFLWANVITMATCSGLIIAKRWPERAVAGLLAVIVAQGLGYGLIFDVNFFLRNLSVVGGLLMVLADSLLKRDKKDRLAGIPSIDDMNEQDRKKYFQLIGRVLLIFLFLGFAFNGKLTLARIVVSVLGLAACVMVALGFKAKASGSFLVVLLSVFNLFVNNWWSLHGSHPQRDFLKYDFFQTLSIVGGLLLLVNIGSGSLSMDHKKSL